MAEFVKLAVVLSFMVPVHLNRGKWSGENILMVMMLYTLFFPLTKGSAVAFYYLLSYSKSEPWSWSLLMIVARLNSIRTLSLIYGPQPSIRWISESYVVVSGDDILLMSGSFTKSLLILLLMVPSNP